MTDPIEDPYPDKQCNSRFDHLGVAGDAQGMCPACASEAETPTA